MIRVFPRKTNASPTDELAFFTGPPLWDLPTKKVMVSCTFTYDKPRAENLACQWSTAGYNVQLGGPAFDDPGGEFIPGRFLSKEHVFTSRGCNNRCWFCCVPQREGSIRELTIRDGWRVLDSNLLQCSEKHIRAVFEMLKRQPIPVSFLGGFEARRFQRWHIDLLKTIRLSTVFFAYDTPDDYEPLRIAARMLKAAGFTHNRVRCYCLIGYPKDTFEKAEQRLQQVVGLDMVPTAMLYRDHQGDVSPEWVSFQNDWFRPIVVCANNKGKFGKSLGD